MPRSEQGGPNRYEPVHDRPPETEHGVAITLFYLTRDMTAAERRKCLDAFRQCLRAARGDGEGGDGRAH